MSKQKNLKSIEQSIIDNSKESLNANNGYMGVGNAGKQKVTQNKR